MQLKREEDKMKISRHLERARKVQALIQADIDDLTDKKEVSSALKNKSSGEEAYEEKHGIRACQRLASLRTHSHPTATITIFPTFN